MYAEDKVTRKLKKSSERPTPAPKPKAAPVEKRIKIQKKGKQQSLRAVVKLKLTWLFRWREYSKEVGVGRAKLHPRGK